MTSTSTARGRHTILAATLAAALGVPPVVAACTGGGDFSVASGSSGSSGVGGVGGITDGPAPPTSGSPGRPQPEVPFVACSPDEPDEPADGGGDGGDASVAEVDASTGDGGATSPCDVPPEGDCLDSTHMVRYGEGPCIAGRCEFEVHIASCPGGCFRQIDGGDRCNE